MWVWINIQVPLVSFWLWVWGGGKKKVTERYTTDRRRKSEEKNNLFPLNSFHFISSKHSYLCWQTNSNTTAYSWKIYLSHVFLLQFHKVLWSKRPMKHNYDSLKSYKTITLHNVISIGALLTFCCPVFACLSSINCIKEVNVATVTSPIDLWTTNLKPWVWHMWWHRHLVFWNWKWPYLDERVELGGYTLLRLAIQITLGYGSPIDCK